MTWMEENTDRAKESGGGTTPPGEGYNDPDPGFEVPHHIRTWYNTRTSLRRNATQLSRGDDHNVWGITARLIHQPRRWIQQARKIGYQGNNEACRGHPVEPVDRESRRQGLAELRRQIWRQTEDCMELRGYDMPTGEWIALKLAPTRQTLVVPETNWKANIHAVGAVIREVPTGRYRVRMPSDLINPALLNTVRCSVQVVNADCLHTAESYVRRGDKVAVLNMANAKSAGGGFRSGAGAQEENIYRRSDAHRFLWCRRDALYPLKTGEVIISKGVTVFRGLEESGYPFLEHPFQVTILSCAAMSQPPLRTRGHVASSDFSPMRIEPEMEPEAEDDMRVRVQAILYAAEKSECDTIVLSAFGCGAFRCPPMHVAWIFRQELLKHRMILSRKSIIFAILNDHNTVQNHNPGGNFQPFQDVFADFEFAAPAGRFRGKKRGHDGSVDLVSDGAVEDKCPRAPDGPRGSKQVPESPASAGATGGRAAAFYARALKKGGLHEMMHTMYRDGYEMYKALLRDRRLDAKSGKNEPPVMGCVPEDKEGDMTPKWEAKDVEYMADTTIVEMCEVCGKYPRNPESYDDRHGTVKGPVCCNRCRETGGLHHGARCTQHRRQ